MHCTRLLALLSCSLVAHLAWAQSPPVAETKQATAPGPEVTLEQVAELKQRASESETLSDEQRKNVAELCDKASAFLTKSHDLEKKTAGLQAQLKRATNSREQSDSPPPNSPPADTAPTVTPKDSAAALRAEVAAAEQMLSQRRQELDAVSAEIGRRAKRRQDIPEELAEARKLLLKARADSPGDQTDSAPLLAEAQRIIASARKRYYAVEVRFFEQEQRTYEGASRQMIARRDQATKLVQDAEAQLAEVNTRAASQQHINAEAKAQEAKRAAIDAVPAVKEAADKNAELAERNTQLVDRDQALQQELVGVRQHGLAFKHRLDNVTQRAEDSDGSPAFGAMLRNQQDLLPDVSPLRESLRGRAEEASRLRTEKFEWQTMRDETVAELERTRESTDSSAQLDEVAQELLSVRQARIDILDDLTTNATDCISTLAELETAEKIAIGRVYELSDFIAERVFWVPSAQVMSRPDLRHAVALLANSPSHWQEARQALSTLRTDATTWPLVWLAASIAVLALVALRGWAKRLLYRTGEEASRPTVTKVRPTFQAVFATLYLALPTALTIGFIGWRLMLNGPPATSATGWGVLFFAVSFMVLNATRHACRPGGIGDKHFGWDLRGMTAVRRQARLMQIVVLPLLAVAAGAEATRDETIVNSLGRLSLIAGLLAAGVFCMLLFRPRGPFVSAVVASGKSAWNARAARAAGPLMLLATLSLAIASGLGLHFTAVQLTYRLMVTSGLLLAAIGLRSLLTRWLLMAYRRVAMRRAQEKRQAMLDAQDTPAGEAPVVDTDSQMSLTEVNHQSHNLAGAGVGVALTLALFSVWDDVLPALGVLNQFEVWDSSFTTPDGVVERITLAGLLLAVGTFALTWIAGRNLPGLLEISLFQRLPLDAGARYAASSVSRYLIYLVGCIVGFRLLGIGWQSVQWLVAAMTVGLGFGLQEIFANFVSGVILLFERPVRLGDVVTIGDVTGTVTKIRIRATTIQDWDNKELIVPNREFITGKLINWTLTSRQLRLVIKVGVAYGSDTRLVTDLLYKVAADNPNVLDTPEPFVLFNEFGDSTLNFELRVFVTDIAHLIDLKHAVHMAIDDAFRQHDIEIAFPQRDLHIRSMPVELQGLQRPERSVLEESESGKYP